MWAEAFFEVFTTIVAGYLMVIMGLVNTASVIRVVYLATLLFLGSGLLGIAHNFYWNAKPVATLALGSVFSTMQVVPLLLLTVEAWRFRNLTQSSETGRGGFGMPVTFLFLIAVNFWNFLGAGVFGLIINLPIVNYYEHGTYLTVNHGHAALMGVYGNLSLAAVFFCCGLIGSRERWNNRTARRIFWSINAGLLLMVLMDTLPAGILQLQTVMEKGFWYARSQAFIQDTPFQALTWSRILGGALFLWGGLVPLVYLVLRGRKKVAT
jgi:nitric oxide reductase subunit B